MNYQQAANRLDPLRYSQDLGRLQKTVEELDEEVKKESPEHYFRFMLHVSNILSTHDFRDFERQTALAQKCAAAALASAAAMPLEEEFQVLVHLQDDFEDAQSPQQWPSKRRERVSRWLQALERLDRETKPDFNIQDLPPLNPDPPPGVAVIPGTDPSYIRNSALRRQYEQALQKNRQRILDFGAQVKLQELQSRFVPRAIDYIARAYSRSPVDIPELEGLLKQSKLGPKRQEMILSAIRDLTER